MIRTRAAFIITAILAMMLAACSRPVAPTLPAETQAAIAPTAEPTATPPPPPTTTPLPTATPEPTPTRSTPTPLPEPTRIGPTQQGNEGEATRTPSGSAGISIEPNLGRPGDTVTISGDGFAPGEVVTLHWAALDGTGMTAFEEVEADENGSFTRRIAVPPAANWPGGPAQEGDQLQIRATSASLGEGNFYYANFRYLTPFGVADAPALPYENQEYGYRIEVPDGWTWSWVTGDTSDVRFSSTSGSGNGFIRVESGTDVEALIPVIMAEEFPGQGYTTGLLGAGAYPGTQATTDSGRTVQFIPSGGRTYVLSFVADNGQPMWSVIGTFALR